MDVLFILIPVSTVLVGIAVAAFVWAVRDGQFDDADERGRLPDDELTPR